MSSIIVLDSSDEDESPPKKANNNRRTSDNGNSSSTVTNASLLKNQQAKQRQIPSGLTITPRLSPTTTKGVSGSGGGGGGNLPILASATSLAASYQALNNRINNERLTPTPPKAQAGNVNPRKRKTPTPPQPQSAPLPTLPRLTTKNFASMTTNSSPAKAATTLAPLPPIMPMITGVHSMAAAGATPPLQLMATPPHNMAGYMGLNEQLMINPHLLPTSLPPNTTITAHQQPTNPNQNNINNNFKIHLPFNKPTTTTPSPAASPASSAPKTPSPQLAPSPQPMRTDKSAAKRIKPTTLLKSSDESWQKHKQQSQRTPISLSNDVVIEMLPPANTTESPKSTSASSSRHHTPMTSPTTPKSQKSPDVIMLTPTNDHSNNVRHADNDTILDLTQSPEKLKRAKCTTPTTGRTEIVDLVNTPVQKRHINGIDAAAAATTKQTKSAVSLLKGTESKSEKPPPPPPKPPLEPEYEELIKVCRQADPSNDMEKLIKSKLLKYYYEVHGDFVKSKSFRKSIRNVVDSIKAKPDLVYFNLKTIVEELKVRRKARIVEEATAAAASATANNGSTGLAANEETPAKDKVKTEDIKAATQTTNSPTATTASSTSSGQSTNANDISATAATSTGNKKLDEQIKKLNKALYVLTKRIEVLEQAEVDWDDDDSSFLQVERYKKRACQIYEKICDLTGESKNAHRLVKKPIKFNETRIPQFNKTLQAFINRTKEFPDYFDVLRMLEHCNRTYSLGLVNFEIKNIAEDAFIKVGKLLQSRRKADLYETVTHYAGDGLDPAKTDPSLAAKLNENLKNHKKISDILEKFARKQDMPEEEQEEEQEKATDKTTTTNSNSREEEATTASTSNTTNNTDTKEIITQTTELNSAVVVNENEVVVKPEENKPETDKTKNEEEITEDVYDDEEEEEDEEDDDEDDGNLDEQVETLANGDVSDNESDTEIIMSPKEAINSTKEASGHNKSIENVLNDKNNALDNTVISLNTSSESSIIVKNCMDKENNSAAIIQINSESNDSIYVNNNNNNLDTTTTTKTVINTPITIDKDKSLIPSSSSSPPPTLVINPLAATPNGKLKDMSPLHHQLFNSNNSTTTTSPESIVFSNVNATITATTTTTKTTADLKIVHVSSLEPDDGVVDGDDDDDTVLLSDSKRNKNVTNLCASSASKSLEEIVISDEES